MPRETVGTSAICIDFLSYMRISEPTACNNEGQLYHQLAMGSIPVRLDQFVIIAFVVLPVFFSFAKTQKALDDMEVSCPCRKANCRKLRLPGYLYRYTMSLISDGFR